MGRKTCTTHTYDTSILNLFNNGFVAKAFVILTALETCFDKFSIAGYNNRIYHVSSGNSSRFDCLDSAGNT